MRTLSIKGLKIKTRNIYKSNVGIVKGKQTCTETALNYMILKHFQSQTKLNILTYHDSF